MNLTILGNNSALPNHDRFPTAQVLGVGTQNFLIDCGEGTQVRLQRHNVKISRITKIFISHLHGDHYFGLIGLLTRLSLNHHTHPIDLYAPALLKDIIELQLSASSTILSFPLNFHPVSSSGNGVLYSDSNIEVKIFPTEHRIECYGFTFVEKRSNKRKVDIQACEKHGIPHLDMKKIVSGEDYVKADGEVIPNHQLTLEPEKDRKYSYCADTRYTESFLEHIRDSDWIYHETTYLKEEKELAATRFHSTSEDAAQIALLSGARSLLIGHFSSKYKQLEAFLSEAKSIFPDTHLSYEGQVIEI